MHTRPGNKRRNKRSTREIEGSEEIHVGISSLKREKIFSKLERIIKTTETEKDLPLRAKEIYVFGSTLWKDNPKDLDLILIHEALTEEEAQREVQVLFGYGTFLFQQMNRRLKRSNAERIKILYGTSLENVLSSHPIGYFRLYWSKAKPGWRGNLEMDKKDLKDAILKLREIIDDLTQARIKYQLTLNEIMAKRKIDWKELMKIEDEAEKRAKDGEKPTRFRF